MNRRRKSDTDDDHIALVEQTQQSMRDAEALLKEYEALLRKLRKTTRGSDHANG